VLSRERFDWTGLFTPDINRTFLSRATRQPTINGSFCQVVMLYLNLTKAPFKHLLSARPSVYA